MKSPDPPLPPSPRLPLSRSLVRLAHGIGSLLLLPFFPLGHWIDLGAGRFEDSRRESEGLVVVLTGIQGASFLEQLMVLGLADAGFGGRMTIVDWTTGRIWRFASHMRDSGLQHEAARRIAARVAEFRTAHPTAPIHLVGYSGGAAVVLQTLDELPAGEAAIVDRVVLLAAACSPDVSVNSRLARTRAGIWHFRSRWDRIFLGLLTRVIGTTDGKHGVAAGCTGFSGAPANHADREDMELDERRFHEHAFRLAWLRQFHYGGHLGYANRVWAGETLGRILAKP